MDNSTLIILLAALAIWFLQGLGTLWQGRRIYGRVSELHHLGRLAVGVDKGTLGTRVYGALIVDGSNRVTKAEQLSGYTIFAKFKPVDALVGLSLSEVLDLPEKAALPDTTPRLIRAFKQAATTLAEKASELNETLSTELQGGLSRDS